MTETNPFSDLLRNAAGMTDPNVGFHCTKCKYELTRVKSGQAFDFQKMFYCTNKDCAKFGMVTVVAVQKKKN